jgi:hypothetical protein
MRRRASPGGFALLHAGAASLLLVASASPVSAEFEIQESTIDAGEIQLQYRGAGHSGLAKGNQEAPPAAESVLPDEEEGPLRQSHEFELQMSVTSHWLLAFTHAFDQPDDEDFRLSAIEFESQIELITLEGDGFGLAVQGGGEKPLEEAIEEEPGDFHFGPIVELAKSKFLLTLNPLFFKEQGELAEQEGLGFEYGWQGRYQATKRLSLALEMFGEIEDLANAGPFKEQLHSIGPAFYYTFGDVEEVGEEAAGNRKYQELTVSLGAQFGLTEQASDVALKVFIGYEFN